MLTFSWRMESNFKIVLQWCSIALWQSCVASILKGMIEIKAAHSEIHWLSVPFIRRVVADNCLRFTQVAQQSQRMRIPFVYKSTSWVSRRLSVILKEGSRVRVLNQVNKVCLVSNLTSWLAAITSSHKSAPSEMKDKLTEVVAFAFFKKQNQ